jgi:hypothetical protein
MPQSRLLWDPARAPSSGVISGSMASAWRPWCRICCSRWIKGRPRATRWPKRCKATDGFLTSRDLSRRWPFGNVFCCGSAWKGFSATDLLRTGSARNGWCQVSTPRPRLIVHFSSARPGSQELESYTKPGHHRRANSSRGLLC